MSQPPLFSVIIPTYDRGREVVECLRSMERMRFGHQNFEVIVVDDGSPCPVELSSLRLTFQTTVLRQSRRGPAAARNHGAGAASGRYLVFTDDDCLADSGWLGDLERCFKRSPRDGFGGRVQSHDASCPFCSTSQLIIDCAQQHFPPVPGSMFFISTNNLAVPRQDFLDLGGFNTDFRTSEDREFCRRWLSSGRSLHRVEGARVSHRQRLTLKSFAMRHFAYGRGAFRFHRQGGSGQSAWTLSLLSFYARVFGRPLRELWHDPGQLRVLALLLVWQVANLGGFVTEMLAAE